MYRQVFACTLLFCTLALLGCARHKHEAPSIYTDLDSEFETGPGRELQPEYYVLAYSQLNVAGRRVPTCPFEVLQTVQARTASLGDTWEEDKQIAAGQRTPAESTLFDDIHHNDPEYQPQDIYFPKRLESKLLDLLREKAQRLGADAVVNITIYHQEESSVDITVQNKEIGSEPSIEKITGQAIRFTDPDCRQ